MKLHINYINFKLCFHSVLLRLGEPTYKISWSGGENFQGGNKNENQKGKIKSNGY